MMLVSFSKLKVFFQVTSIMTQPGLSCHIWQRLLFLNFQTNTACVTFFCQKYVSLNLTVPSLFCSLAICVSWPIYIKFVS